MFFQRCDAGIHDFEPRYNLMLPTHLKASNVTTHALETLKDKVYIRDICTRCGKTVELPEKK